MYHTPSFAATPQGILVHGLPLAKAAPQSLAPASLRYINRASELLKDINPEDWQRERHGYHEDIPSLATVNILLALAQPLGADFTPITKAGFNPSQPRDALGMWTGASGVGSFDPSSMTSLFERAFFDGMKRLPSEVFDSSNDRIDSIYPLESLIGFLGGGAVLRALRTVATVDEIVSHPLDNAFNAIRDYLGADAKMIKNKDGDLVLMTDTQKVRFNINNPHTYEPHFHIEEWSDNSGKWVDAGDQHMYFFRE